jgi:hypothetical protein
LTTTYSSKFQIEKKLCLPFSRTIRINIKPIWLLVNKTKHKIKFIEKVLRDSPPNSESKASINEISYDLNSSNGQLCLSDISPYKKYKISITNEEYFVDNLKTSNLDLKKSDINYESDWFMLKDEPVSPFYRQKSTLQFNSLYLVNKCWIDLKLYPVGDQSSLYKQIYFVLNNDEDGQISANTNCKILTLKSKFVVKNKTKYDFRFKLLNQFLKQNEINKLLSRYISIDENLIRSQEKEYSVCEILNKKDFYLISNSSNNTEIEDSSLSKEMEKAREKLSDLFYFHIDSLENQNNTSNSVKLRQSKPLILTCNEKALKQISTQTQSNENLLISRQCFNIYFDNQSSKSLILTQKLLVEQNGQLVLIMNEDEENVLVDLHNTLDFDVYIWPRISSNYIFEFYVKNLKSINEKIFSDLLKEEIQNNQKKSNFFSSLNRQNSSNFTTSQILSSELENESLTFMHFIPAKTTFKFNYDFIGTNQYPIENMFEQLFFMFGLAYNKKLDTKLNISHASHFAYELSPNLSKIYETNFEIDFFNRENRSKMCTFFYLSPENDQFQSLSSDNQTKLRIDRFLSTEDRNSFKFHSKIVENKSEISITLNACIDRLTLALNDDDYLSNVHQTEILRLTSENIHLRMKQYLLGDNLDKNTLVTVKMKCQNLQLDNQLFDNEEIVQIEENNIQLKYDFPVIFLPREEFLLDLQKTKKKIRFTKSFDIFRDVNLDDNFSSFIAVKFILFKHNQTENFSLTSLDVDLKQFDVYLEDYLLFNLIQIFIDYFDHLTTNLESSISYEDDDLNQLVKPMVVMNRFKINNLDALVNLQTKLKIYLATYKMPIKFDEFELNGFPFQFLTNKQMINRFTNHYLTALIFRAGWLLGSLDLIGSPTAFIQQASNGLYDFLYMPYSGLKQSGANGLLRGISHGSLSLMRNLSAGTITSLTSFAAFISRNMDILSFDQNHLIRQDQLRHELLSSNTGLAPSGSNLLLNLSTSFMVTIMGAIGGLAEQPIQSVYNSESILKGFSKGIIGLVTKPVGAVAELVNQTGQGLMKYTGVNSHLVPSLDLRLRRKALNKEFGRFSISVTKCLWKLIACNQNSNNNHSVMMMINYTNNIHSMIEAVSSISEKEKFSLSSNNELSSCYLILNDEILYVVDKNEDMLLRAFYISEIDIRPTSNSLLNDYSSLSLLVLTLNNQPKAPLESNFEMDRLVDYVLNMNSNNHSQSMLMSQQINAQKHIFCEEENVFNEFYKLRKRFLVSSSACSMNFCLCGAQILSLNSINRLNITDSINETINNTNINANKHVRQASNSSDIAKVHCRRISSGISVGALTSNLNDSNENLNLNRQHSSIPAKQFFYYVDPRLSENFINVFNSLKRKASNKGFQF